MRNCKYLTKGITLTKHELAKGFRRQTVHTLNPYEIWNHLIIRCHILTSLAHQAQLDVEAAKREAATSAAAATKAEQSAEEYQKKLREVEVKLNRAEAKIKILESSLED